MGLDLVCCGEGGGSVQEGGGEEVKRPHPFTVHLQKLTQAVLDWLEVESFEALDDNARRIRQKYAMFPLNQQAEEPEAYRFYLVLQESGLPPVSGGALDQPYVLSRELQAVRSGIAEFAVEERNREALIRELESK